MKATLPTVSDYAANRMAPPQYGSARAFQQNYAQDLISEQKDNNRALMAQLAQDTVSKIADSFASAYSAPKPIPQPMEQWKGVQLYSNTPNSNNLPFTPMTPPQVLQGQEYINPSGGLLSNLKMATRPTGTNMNYTG